MIDRSISHCFGSGAEPALPKPWTNPATYKTLLPFPRLRRLTSPSPVHRKKKIRHRTTSIDRPIEGKKEDHAGELQRLPGCGDACAIRPCLDWIRSPDARDNATIFLAKFYGRAGLLNLLAAGTDASLRPVLYEACGRVGNPVYGASGLFSSGRWEACQDAVQAMLEGRRIAVQPEAVTHLGLLAAYDLRHVPKPKVGPAPSDAAGPLGISCAGHTRFKRASSSSTARSKRDGNLDRAPSHEESAEIHDQVEDVGMAVEAAKTRGETSEDTDVDEGSHVSQAEQSPPVPPMAQDEDEIGLELTLGFGPATRVARPPPVRFDASSSSAESGHIGLLLDLPA